MRFEMTAKTLARLRMEEEENAEAGGKGWNELTMRNVKKVTQFRKGGESELQRRVGRLVREKREGSLMEERRA